MKISKHRKSNLILLIVVITLATLNMLIITYLLLTKVLKYDLSPRSLLVSAKLQTLCPDCNVIMVSLDTLSANHLPCHGYERDTAPNLCAFAEENIFFENAYSNATWTLPSHVSVFTGLFSFHHGVIDSFKKLSPAVYLYPELLKNLGYNIMFFIPPDDPTLPVDNVYGRLGDSVYDNSTYYWSESINKFRQSVDSGTKTFMFLHTYAVHAPYLIGDEDQKYPPYLKDLPDPLNRLPTNQTQFDNINWSTDFVDNLIKKVRSGTYCADCTNDKKAYTSRYFTELLEAYPDYDETIKTLKVMMSHNLINYVDVMAQQYIKYIDKNNSTNTEVLRSLYDQSINRLDKTEIEQLIKLIEDPLYKDNTILVIFADHGEEFMEHGHLYHETTFNPNVHVPLIMHIPGVVSKKISQPVQLTDIVPTLNEILGIKTTFKYDGKSFVRRIFGFDRSLELIVIDGWRLVGKALIYGDWKLMLTKQDNDYHISDGLYNLKSDAGEMNNIIFQNGKIKNLILKKYLNISPSDKFQ